MVWCALQRGFLQPALYYTWPVHQILPSQPWKRVDLKGRLGSPCLGEPEENGRGTARRHPVFGV